ncbi:MAG: succinate dehydrogenase cytochrome b subunit [Nannocystaceae bacterium]|nr:succinate dehydrogenase cytochrome b subunit [Nannocystaceae bacterium]
MRASILPKACMGLSGLFLLLFVLVHMAGNLQLFLPEHIARPSFNAYSQALSSSIAIKVAGWLTYATILGHTVVSAMLAGRHRGSRPAYALERAASSSPWYARSMGWLGVIILAFLVLHMQAFWYRYHWGELGVDEHGNKDLYAVVVSAFRNPWVVVVYVTSMLALGFHLQHGIAAALRSLGVFSGRITRLAPRLSRAVAWVVAGTFAAMPVYVYLTSSGRSP